MTKKIEGQANTVQANEAKNMGDVGVKTPAEQTIVAHNPHSMSEILSKMVDIVGKMKFDDATEFFKKSLAQIGHEADSIPAGDADANKKSIDTKPSNASPKIVDDVKSILFKGEAFSEEFQARASVLFEAQVSLRTNLEVARITEEIQKSFDEKLEEQKTVLENQIDEYLADTANQWLDENEVAVKNTLMVEMTQDFMEGLRTLFIESNFDVPADKVDVVESLAQKVTDLESRLAESEKSKEALQIENMKAVVKDVFKDVSEGLTLLDVEKFRKLSETIDFQGDAVALRKSLEIIKEAHFKEAPEAKDFGTIKEETVEVDRSRVIVENVKEVNPSKGQSISSGSLAAIDRLMGTR